MTGSGTSDSSAAQAKITIGSMVHVAGVADEFTFGRGPVNSHQLGAADVGVSRTAGAIAFRNGFWWLVNKSTTSPLVILEAGLRETLLAGRSRQLVGPVTVWLDGHGTTYRIDVDVPPLSGRVTAAAFAPAVGAAAGGAGAAQPGLVTSGVPELSRREREVCELLFEPLFRVGTRSDPIPTKYAVVAQRLGLPESTVRRRVDNLRARLTRLGVANLDGRTALGNLGEYLISRRLIGPGRPAQPADAG